MYAIIRTGGKQFRVQPGDVVRVEKLDREPGSEFDLTDILVVGGDKTFVGEPNVKDATVTVVVTKQSRAPKIIVFKKKRRQGYRRMQGHRQNFTELFIKAITTPEGQTTQSDKTAPVYDPKKREARLEKKAEERKAQKQAARSGSLEAQPVKKKVAKKAAKKKVAKKAAGKKKTAKSAGKKKAAKKTKKKASK